MPPFDVERQYAEGGSMSAYQLQSSRRFVTQLFDALGVHAGGEHDAAVARNKNPLEGAGSEAKKQMLALHVAFPNELLPALDLLDRSLVTRFHIRRDTQDQAEGAAPQDIRGHVEARPAGTAGNNDNEHITAGPHPHARPAHGLGRPASSDAEMREAPPPGVPDDEGRSMLHHARNEALDTVYYVRSAQQRSSRYSTSFDTLTSYEVRLRAWNCSCPAFAFSAFPPVHPEPSVPMYEPGPGRQAEGDEWSFGGASLADGIPPVCKHLLACVLAERCEGLFGGCVEERVVGVEEAAGWAAGWGD
ncbi:uncharacterized protein N0V89_010039 [Didymosphaeria variabile]|uniref:SWIM-type domain-containing protein n=1 Tax=Didymosphaeria variabile TaxID=1932322 RepID=A0A9W8XEG4_9PLEO|nr:uncharacterized protein N0V89_010039 [Didymosphaeria variabile]KAJ4348661.1 hypothetical protein N0V89_010039 [Didymosphaeria variabile]